MNNVVYHGSHISGLDIIKKKKGSHKIEVVYASSNISLPLIFIRNKNYRDFDMHISCDEDGVMHLVERRENLFEDIYNLSGSIYVLNGDNFTIKTKWKPEILSDKDEVVLKEIKIYKVFDALEEAQRDGHLKIYRYPDRPEFLPMDNSDLIDKSIFLYNNGFETTIDTLLKLYPEFTDTVNNKLGDSTKKRR